MDHISLPRGTTQLPIQVPYICGHLELCSILDYLQWLQHAPQWFDARRHVPLDDLIPELQNRLYFGLLRAFLCRDVNQDDFLRSHGGKLEGNIVDSIKVEAVLHQWSRNPLQEHALHFHSKEMREAHGRSIEGKNIYDACGHESRKAVKMFESALETYRTIRHRDCFALLRQTYDVFHLQVLDYLLGLEPDTEADVWDSPTYAIIFSIDVLMDQLEHTLDLSTSVRALGSRDLRRCPLVSGFEPLRRSILRAGRCPSLPWTLQLSATEYYRLLFLPVYSAKQDHSACTYRRCRRFEKPKTKHRDGCSEGPDCQLVESDLRFVIECIDASTIPLIQLEEGKEGEIQIKTVKGDLQSDFTAISHVWAGGLGNQNLNAMYQCQLRYLFESVIGQPPALPFTSEDPVIEFINDILDNGDILPDGLRATSQKILGTRRRAKKSRRQPLLWIDTLCIPPLPRDSKIAKHIAARLGVADLAEANLEVPKAKAIDGMAQLYAAAEKVLVLDPELRNIPSVEASEDRILAAHIRTSPWMSRSWPLQEGALAQNLYFQLMDRSVRLDWPRFDQIGLPSLTLSEFYDGIKSTGETSDQPLDSFPKTWNGLVNRSTTEAKDLPAIIAAMMGRSAREVIGLADADRMKSLLKDEAQLPLTLFYQPGCLTGELWNPTIPGAHEEQTFIHNHFGILARTRNGFVVTQINDTVCVLVQNCPNSAQFSLHLAAHEGAITFWIRQNAILEEINSYAAEQTVLFLSKLCGVGSSLYHGARFRVTTMTAGQLRLRFQSNVMWRSCRGASHSVPEDDIPHCTRLDTPPQGVSAQEIIIESDTDSWPSLEWTRSVALPVHEIVDNGIVGATFSIALTCLTQFIAVGLWHQLHLGRTPQRVLDWPWAIRTSFSFYIPTFIQLLRFFPELGRFSRRLIRSVQASWAATFYHNNHENSSSSQIPEWESFPSRVPSGLTGTAFLLSWIAYRSFWLAIPALLLLTERPIFYAWKLKLRKVGMLNRANFEHWIVTREALRQIFCWAATASFIVLPVIAVGWFAVAQDYQLMAPFVAHPLAYIACRYYKLDVMAADRVYNQLSVIWIFPFGGLLMAFTYSIPFVILGFRDGSWAYLVSGIGGCCVASGMVGFFFGWRERADENWLDVFGPKQKREAEDGSS